MGPPRLRMRLQFTARADSEPECPCACFPGSKPPCTAVALGIRKAVMRSAGRLQCDRILFRRAGIRPRCPAYPKPQVRKHFVAERKLDPFIEGRPQQCTPSVRERSGEELVRLQSVRGPYL